MITPRIAEPSVTRRIIKAFGLRASKRFGQNFLIAPEIVQKITEAANIEPGEEILEIGPGIGTLTQSLAEAGGRVTAVEIDKKLPAVLKETLSGYDVNIISGDILKMDLAEIMKGNFKVVANLPYYITTPIIMTLLENRPGITCIVTLVQREVAERMTASPGGKDYGALSVSVQYFTSPEIIMNVPPECFFPRPDVTSSVISCSVRSKPAVKTEDENLFFRVVRAAFGKRRKTLLNSLTGAGFLREVVKGALDAAEIDPNRRGETLTIEEFARLSDAIYNSLKLLGGGI